MELSIQRTLSLAIQSIKKDFGFYFAIALLFYGMSVALDFMALWIAVDGFFIGMLFMIVSFAIYAKQSVVVHRSVILNESNQWNRVFTWGSPDNQFLLIVLGLWLLGSISIGVFSVVLIPFMKANSFEVQQVEMFMVSILLFMFVIGGSIFSRICLSLPSRAVGSKMSFADSFERTKGHGFKIFVLIVLLPLVTNILVSELFSENILIYDLIISLLAHLLIVFQISVLSHTFMALTPDEEQTESTEVNI